MLVLVFGMMSVGAQDDCSARQCMGLQVVQVSN